MATTLCPAQKSMTPSNRHYIGRPSIQVMGTLQEPTFSLKKCQLSALLSQKSQPCQRRMEVGEEGVWDSDVPLSAGVLNQPSSRDKRPQMQAPMSFLAVACAVLRTSQEWKFHTKYFFIEKILFQSAMCFHILFTFMRVEELQHFMGVAQLCKMRLLRTPGSTNKIVHCELFSSGRYFFPFTYSDNCRCNIFLLLFY